MTLYKIPVEAPSLWEGVAAELKRLGIYWPNGLHADRKEPEEYPCIVYVNGHPWRTVMTICVTAKGSPLDLSRYRELTLGELQALTVTKLRGAA